MSNEMTLTAELRELVGKGASRRLRRLDDKVPAIVYGGEEAPKMITLLHRELLKKLENEAFFSSIITLDIGGETEEVLLKDLQRHPAQNRYMHLDFLRVVRGQKITLTVPLHFINEESCHGVKMQGGSINHLVNEIEISCLPKDIPEFIEVDMIAAETGTTIHISDIQLPEGVESTALAHGEEHDLAVANVVSPRGGASDDADEGGAADAADEEAGEE